MTENNMNAVIAVETNTDALKEALCVQQRLLQKLYNELDVEREAASTAASEALSMILRLQGEKAAVKMEAEQYKRLAEEKMYHAEESMEIFEEVMYQKEMDIAYLDYQVRAYRHKLLRLGFDDLGVNDIKFHENLLQRNETLGGETSPENTTKRNPTPPIPKRFKLPNLKKGTLERDRSTSPDSDMIEKVAEEGSWEDEHYNTCDWEKKAEGSSSVDINTCLEQIRKLDKIVEEVAGEKIPSFRGRSARSSSVPCKLNELNFYQSLRKSEDDKISSDACSSSVHDVFEVPQANESLVSSEKQAKDEGKSMFKDEEKSSKLPNVPQQAKKSYAKHGINSGKKALPPKHKDKKALLPRDGPAVHLAHIQPAKVAEPESVSQQTSTTTEITESESEGEGEGEGEARAEGQNVRQEPVTTRRGVALRLLYEIREKLNSIQSDILRGNTKTKKSSPNCDLPMLQLTEAMLHFWL